jgi:hypothetical protein
MPAQAGSPVYRIISGIDFSWPEIESGSVNFNDYFANFPESP